jgi:hypothetical protein
VRSFYNNILDPHSANNDVTIDTHAVGAALLRDLGQKSVPVAQNFGTGNKTPGFKGASGSIKTGNKGTYPLYAEAYHRAAKELGLQPRQLQSAVWVVKRTVFGKLSDKENADVEAAWKKYHDDPTVTLAQTQQAIADIAGLKTDARRSYRDDGEGGSAGHARKLYRPKLGPAATRMDGRARRAAARRAARLVAVRGAQRRARAQEIASEREFDPNEPRDEHGQWTDGGGSEGSGEGSGGAGPGGARSAEQAQGSAAKAAAGYPKLAGLPDKPIKLGEHYLVPGPLGKAKAAAEKYAQSAGLPFHPPAQYLKVDKERATRIADAFDKMKHAPDDPAVKASYEALAKETIAQWHAIKDTGLKIEWIKPGQPDPYAASPRMAAMDVINNNHWWGFPTDAGFGSGPEAEAAIHNNPMLKMTDEVVDGRKLMVNDVFRIVHDYFGHFKEGVGFRADGEENAWRSHSAMYSDLARGAMTSETRGQNSWVNYGPYGESNRTASAAETHYAPQKIGLMPEWTWNEGREDPKKKLDAALLKARVRAAVTYAIIGARARARALREKYSDDEPRDEHGRWTDGGGGSGGDEKPSGGDGGGKEHPGPGYSASAYVKDGIIHTTSVYDAQRALHEDRKVELDQPRKVSILLQRLGEEAKAMIAKGEKAPNLNLCNVTVSGTNLFCADTKGIPRVQMPQLDAQQTIDFQKYLKDQGYTLSNEKQFASHLRATQNELNGIKVAGTAEYIAAHGGEVKPIIVSNDDYILDGHHSWAAKIGLDAANNRLEDNAKMDVTRVGISITKLLEEAEKFTGGKGHKPATESAMLAAGQILARVVRERLGTR